MTVCAACGEENPDRARFCLACAAPLVRAAPVHEERKVVSVLFVDLVGFTASSDDVDPEDVRATLRPYHEAVKADIDRFGGTVEKFIGDAVMAVFGAPVAHEDDAERAVRAGLRVLETTAKLGLQVRAAVNTGEAVVSLGARAERGEGLVAGDVVNTASRLQSAAATGTLVVGELTYRTTSDKIEFDPLDAVTVKGKAEPVTLWQAIRARSRFGVDAEIGAATPFVGRDHESVLLQETFMRVEREAAPQLVTIVGEPGVGKTRLLRELGRWLDDRPGLVYWRQGRCLPYGEGVTFWALGEIVKAHAGILETDPPDDALAKLELAVRSVVADPSEGDWIAARLAPLAGLAGDAAGATREESFTAWRQFLEALAAERPLVLLFEDVHWADSALLEFVDHLLDWSLGVPLLVLCTARPELYERHPAWGGGKRNSTTVSLSPLAAGDTARLLSALLSEAVLPVETQELLLERCGGNPLYAEQFVRMLTDRGILERRGHALRVAEGTTVPVPETVQALIAARLDTLGPERKSILQDASVVGKVFWAAVVAALGSREEHDVVGSLVDLAHKDLVRPARSSSFESQREFVFTHALVRDVAYGQIPRAERAQKHRATAAWIEETVGDRVEDHSEQLAYHYGEALTLGRASGAGEDELDDVRASAVRFLRLAGDRARELDAGRATEIYERALGLARDSERPELLLAAGRNDLYAGRLEQGEQRYTEVVAAYRKTGETEQLAIALNALGHASWLLGRPDAGRHRSESVELLENGPPTAALASALAGRAGQLMIMEQAQQCLEHCERALAVARATGSRVPEIQALQFRGIARMSLGDSSGIVDVEEALKQSLDAGLGSMSATTYVNVGYWHWWTSGPPAGAEVFREGIEFSRRRGLDASVDWAEAELIWALLDSGDWDEAIAIGEPIAARAAEGSLVSSMVVGSLARVHLERGAVGRAQALIDPLVPRVAGGALTPQVVVPAFTVAAGVALATGARGRALELLAELERLTRDRNRSRATEAAEAARIGAAAGDTSAAAAIVADQYPGMPRAEAQHVAALAVLAEAADDGDGALALYRDAAARWEAFGHPLEHAYALSGIARIAGDGAAEAAATAIFARLGAVPRFGTDAVSSAAG